MRGRTFLLIFMCAALTGVGAGCDDGEEAPNPNARSSAEVRQELRDAFEVQRARLDEALSHADELTPDPSEPCRFPHVNLERAPIFEAAPTWAEARGPTFPEDRFPLGGVMHHGEPITSSSSAQIHEAFRFPRVAVLVRTRAVAGTAVDVEEGTFEGRPSAGTVAVYDRDEGAIVCIGDYALTMPGSVVARHEDAPDDPTAVGQARSAQASAFNQASAQVEIDTALRAQFERQMESNLRAVRAAANP